jgi:N-acetylglucosamine-6-phosphate deacetylase
VEDILYTAANIFTGEKWLKDHVIVVSDDHIKAIVPHKSLGSSQKIIHFDNCTIAPAFIDLQIYGAGGKLLAVYPEADSLFKLKAYCNEGGAAWFLPTVATNTKEVFFAAIDAVRDYWEQKGEGVLGLHLEGPWINKIKRGAHIEELVHSPSIPEVQELLEYGQGIIKMITLAPEVCSAEIIRLIQSYGIIISAGHSNASYDEAKLSFQLGIKTVTHLFNAMSPLQHRNPGLVGAAMDDDSVFASIIADGHHVDFPAIRIAKQVMKHRLFLITDAVTETGEGPYKHTLANDKYEASGILSGSNLTMTKAVQNMIKFAAVETGEAICMASTYPAKLMGLSTLGKIEAGCSARMVVLDEQLEVKQML